LWTRRTPQKYFGGGYFRDKTVPKGISADMQHGDEVIGKFCDEFRQVFVGSIFQ
jgi:hypothetical protein